MVDAILSTLAAADRIGVRILLVHALHEPAVGFYEELRFTRSPADPLHLFLLPVDALKSLGGPVLPIRAVLTGSVD